MAAIVVNDFYSG